MCVYIYIYTHYVCLHVCRSQRSRQIKVHPAAVYAAYDSFSDDDTTEPHHYSTFRRKMNRISRIQEPLPTPPFRIFVNLSHEGRGSGFLGCS